MAEAMTENMALFIARGLLRELPSLYPEDQERLLARFLLEAYRGALIGEMEECDG